VSDTGVGYNGRVDASSFHTLILGPEERIGRALKEGQEEVESCKGEDRSEGCVYYDFVCRLDANPEEEDCNREANEEGSDGIE